MATIDYVEDALAEVLSLYPWDHGELSWQDHTILTSLGNAVTRSGALTRKQSGLLLKLLVKYQLVLQHKIDLTDVIANPKWRYDFRKLDLSKSIKVEQDTQGTVWIVMKFPYDLLTEFEDTVVASAKYEHTPHSKMQWDTENRVRKLDLYDFNIVVIDEFVRKHNFTIDNTFVTAVELVEEIWQNQEQFKPYADVQDNKVVLVNAAPEAVTFFEKSITGNVFKDTFLAKSMGFTQRLKNTATNIVEKITADTNTHFWVKTNIEFLQLYHAVDGVAAIVLDRNTQDIIRWLDLFLADAKQQGISTDSIRVCFREPKDSKIPLNEWIRANNLGGKVENAKLLIFRHGPSKWLFANKVDVKIIGTNSYTPVNHPTAMHWIQSHPCVCYISDIKPTKTRNKQIAHL